MKAIYLIKPITNLHVGNGDVNYNIIDKEVEKDSVTGYPMIHASGIKGALRNRYTGADVDKWFGKPNDTNSTDGEGKISFTGAYLLSRPLRAIGGSIPYVNVITTSTINDFIDTAEKFGFQTGIERIEPSKITKGFYAEQAELRVEGEETGSLDEIVKPDHIKKIRNLLGVNEGTLALAKTFDGFDLPVIARNNLQKGHENLWYEEYVPRKSVLYTIVLGNEPEIQKSVLNSIMKSDEEEKQILQIGANATVGYGYCDVSLLSIMEGNNE